MFLDGKFSLSKGQRMRPLQKFYRSGRLLFFFWPTLILLSGLPGLAQAESKIGHLGVGISNQLANKVPAFSLKLQRTAQYSIALLANLNTSKNDGGGGGALKINRTIFEEPQLAFYGSLLAGYVAQKENKHYQMRGMQIDSTLGVEFSLAGLSSVGFNFEVGVRAVKEDHVVVKTAGDVLLAAYFYI